MSSEVGFFNMLFPGFVCLIKVSIHQSLVYCFGKILLRFMKGEIIENLVATTCGKFITCTEVEFLNKIN